MSRGRSVGLALTGLVLAVLVIAATGGSDPGSPEERPGASARDEGSLGLSGLRDLLERAGHDTALADEVPSRADFNPDATVFLLDPGPTDSEDIDALRAFAAEGGRLVFGGNAGLDGFEELTGTGVDFENAGPSGAVPYLPAPETVDVDSIELAGQGSFADTGAALPLAGDEGGNVILAIFDIGNGSAILLADASPLQNALLADADNAQLGLDLAGDAGRPVVFAERVRFSDATGFAALPADWRLAFAGLVLAGLLLIASRIRRNGPPESPSRELPPARRQYVDAVGMALARTRTPAAADGVRLAARRRLLTGSVAGGGAAPDEVARAGAAAGLAREEWEALLSPVDSEEQMLAAGTALAKLKEVRK